MKNIKDVVFIVQDRTGLKIVGDKVEKTKIGEGFKGIFTAIPPYIKTALMSISFSCH